MCVFINYANWWTIKGFIQCLRFIYDFTSNLKRSIDRARFATVPSITILVTNQGSQWDIWVMSAFNVGRRGAKLFLFLCLHNFICKEARISISSIFKRSFCIVRGFTPTRRRPPLPWIMNFIDTGGDFTGDIYESLINRRLRGIVKIWTIFWNGKVSA